MRSWEIYSVVWFLESLHSYLLRKTSSIFYQLKTLGFLLMLVGWLWDRGDWALAARDASSGAFNSS